MNSNKRKKIAAGTVLLLLFLSICMGVSIYRSAHDLVVNIYRVQNEKVTDDIRLVVLSDQHGKSFGEDNAELVTMVTVQNPDLILLDGDFVNDDAENPDSVCRLIRQMCEIAPVYFAMGNHEAAYENQHPDLRAEIERAGADVLDETYVDLDIRNTKIRLGGLLAYAFGLNGFDEAESAPENVKTYLKDFESTDRMKIMLAHRPDSFILGDASSYWNIDLVISGHLHGGQVVLPYYGGVYGGDQGWFPTYVHGLYKKDQMQIFVTSGLGSYGQKLPRINNRPEVAVLDIVAE